jgi:hypothetical protein
MNVNMISETNEILNGKDCVSKTDHSSRSDAKIRAELIQDGPMGVRDNPRLPAPSFINI